MNYKEMLDLLKAGKLDAEQKKNVEQDIERQRAISDFLFDEEMADAEKNGFSVIPNTASECEANGKESDFVKLINRTIRKSFIKMGIIIGAIVLVTVLTVALLIPVIQEKIYYNPAETVSDCNAYPDSNIPKPKRIELDMAVYTELFCPGMYRDNVNVISNGRGNYSISIIQEQSYSGMNYDFGGVINQNRLLLYNSNCFNKMPVNNWNPASKLASLENFKADPQIWPDKEESFENLEKLNPNENYVAYVTLNRVMDYTEFDSWQKANSVGAKWCKLCFKPGEDSVNDTEYTFKYNIGFIPYGCIKMLDYNKDKYPQLILTGSGLEASISEEKAVAHVSSLLNYLADQSKFLKVLEYDSDFVADIRKYAEEIKQDGLHIYGFVMIGKKDEICALRDIPEVEYITTKLVQYE